jgi:formylmethanofuran dehydrogenase subunit C
MQGGRIVVHGSAGAYAAAALRSGIVEIDRAAGDFLGGALAGEMKGMSGGLVIVRGSAGSRAADRMRRGTIIVEGGIGGYAGSRMIAGTIIVLGEAIGPYPGYGMKRGTLVLRRRAERELPSFTDCGRHDLGFLRLLLRALHGRSRSLDQFAARPAVAQRLVGDLAAGGQGEILLWQP